MTKLILLAALASFCVPTLAATTQQNKMAACNADAKAKNLSGADRKAFMSECLSAAGTQTKAEPQTKAQEKTLTPQQEKMKTCNADAKAKALKGDERKKFMSTCLKS